MSETKSKTLITEVSGNYCKTENGDVYRVKVGLLGDDYMLIGNTDKPLVEFVKGKL